MSDIEDTMPFDFEAKRNIIKVLGVGGGGGNAVNHMFEKGIQDVDFIVANTDAQALNKSPVANKIQLGESLTEGLGAGNQPENGKQAAIESIDMIQKVLNPEQTKMVFITAGMGGGTGTGAAPIIAKAAKEAGILTVGIVTLPFRFEGPKRVRQALAGLEELSKNVDSLLVIDNEKIRDIFGNLILSEAFGRANDILTMAAKGIAEIITKPGHVNVDFADVKTVMQNSGAALMGVGYAEGEDRAVKAAKAALDCPLLNNNDIRGSKNMLVSITSSEDQMLTTEEMTAINSYMQDQAGAGADLIWGNSFSNDLGGKLSVTVIATGFKAKEILDPYKEGVKIKDPVKIESKIEGKTQEPEKKEVSNKIEMTPTRTENNVNAISQQSGDVKIEKKVVENSSTEILHKVGEKIIFDPRPENDKIEVVDTIDDKKIDTDSKSVSEVVPNNKISAVDYSTMVDREFQYIDDKPAYVRKNIQLLVNPKQGEKYEHLKLELPVED